MDAMGYVMLLDVRFVWSNILSDGARVGIGPKCKYSLNMSEFSCRFQENYGVIHLSYIHIYMYVYIYIFACIYIHILTYQIYNNRFGYFFHGTKQLAASCLLPQHISPKVLWSKLMPQKVDAELNLQGIRDLRSPTSHGGNGSPRHTLKGTLNNMAMAGRSPIFP